MTVTAPASTLELVPLASIEEVDAFNPRTSIEQRALEALAESIRRRGVLQPVALDRVDERLLLTAGARRVAAARLAGLEAIPALVVAREGERLEGERLIDAVVENTSRVALSAYEEALACERLREHRFSVKEIAAQLGLSQRKVAQRLKLAALPEAVRAYFAADRLPIGAVDGVAAIAAKAPELAVAACELVTRPGDECDAYAYRRPPRPEDLAADPIAVAAGAAAPELGCYALWTRYAAGDFDLPAELAAKVAELPEWRQALRFERDDAERAQAFGCLLGEPGGDAVICSREWASDAAAQRFRRAVREHNAPEREQAARTAPDTAGETDEQRAERARAEREARKELAASARAHNEQLGAFLYRELGSLALDHDVVRILALVDVDANGADFAARGLRLTHPNWKQLTRTERGGEKVTYLEKQGEVATKLAEFLGGARDAEQWAGRVLQLLLASRLADPRELPRSRRWGKPAPDSRSPAARAARVDELLDALADRLVPEPLRERAAQVAADRDEWADARAYRLPADREAPAA